MKNLSARYPVWLCDVWGVVHDGHKPIASAVTALEQHRATGGKVVFITNAPRPMAAIQAHLDHIGVARAAYDAMVTSGDVTQSLMLKRASKGLFHIGPEHDLSLFEGLDVARVPLAEAGAVICTGFHDEATETAQDYLPLLQQMLSRKLTMICANPDKVVRKGRVLVPCAGAIAEIYEAIGGQVEMAGKPFAPIYDLALARLANPPRNSVLAIGDGPETDIKGAAQNGLACVFISGGINTTKNPEAEVRAAYPLANIVAVMPDLVWA